MATAQGTHLWLPLATCQSTAICQAECICASYHTISAFERSSVHGAGRLSILCAAGPICWTENSWLEVELEIVVLSSQAAPILHLHLLPVPVRLVHPARCCQVPCAAN